VAAAAERFAAASFGHKSNSLAAAGETSRNMKYDRKMEHRMKRNPYVPLLPPFNACPQSFSKKVKPCDTPFDIFVDICRFEFIFGYVNSFVM